eukprot:TRINITY_DN3008_c1_g1_i3.p1 TRINITY_DN3008_c1_g1~~TRINITY_DN3008_c1_g1_i3.p1  ORF type:complete len:632 (-),score=150.91 TRINITY_DN3008_c1_g1_i3:22-1917(-)
MYVSKYLEQNSNTTTLRRRSFHGSNNMNSLVTTPYWQGFYASRPLIKQLHYNITRQLVYSELWNSIALILLPSTHSSVQPQLDELWYRHVPSTHHDYVTGTSNDYVYNTEQIPLSTSISQSVSDILQSLHKTFLNELVSNGFSQPYLGYVTVFNPHTHPFSGLLPLRLSNSTAFRLLESIRNADINNNFRNLFQYNGGGIDGDDSAGIGEFLTYVSAGGLGYNVNMINTSSVINITPASIRNTGTGSFIMENQYVSVIIQKTDGNQQQWVFNLVDKTTGKTNIVNGNTLKFLYDRGNIYRFGYEEKCEFYPLNNTLSITASDGMILENGPLRTTFQATLTAVSTSPLRFTENYTVQYSLQADESFVRVKVIGRAPNYFTIATSLQFQENITKYEHGTPYHWDYKSPFPYGNVQNFKITFEAVHNFFLPLNSQNNLLGAVYHNGSSPAWGVIGDTLYGVILRNTPEDRCANKGAFGSDSDYHNINFAVRSPSGLSSSVTGQPLRESLFYHSPPTAYFSSTLNPSSRLPQSFSLASVVNNLPFNNTFITTVKQGSISRDKLFVRLYNSGNKKLQVNLIMDKRFTPTSTPNPSTSLEEVDTLTKLPTTPTPSGLNINTNVDNTMATVAIGWSAN